MRANKKISGPFDWISYYVNILGCYASGIIIVITGLIVTYEVVMRYIFNSPTVWVMEWSIYGCIACVFFAGGYALREGMHIQVDAVLQNLSPPNQKAFQLINGVLGLLYSVVLTWKGILICATSIIQHEVSPTVLNTPMWIPQSFIPIGGSLLILEFIRQILNISLSILRAEHSNQGNWIVRNKIPIIYSILILLCVFTFVYESMAPIGLTFLLFILIFGGMPVAFALGFIGLTGFFFTFGGGPMLYQVPMVTYKILDNFIMVAVPLFIMLSAILSVGGIGSRLYEMASTWLRHLPGGLGVATIMACAVFAAITGSATATVATIGLIAIPEMLSRGYPKSFVYGTVAIGGVLGPLIPPSIFMILIGHISGDSVGKLFMAGVIPGLFLVLIFSIYIVLRCIKDKDLQKAEPASWTERWRTLGKTSFGMLAPLVILGGIYLGIFTPSEAAGVGLVYSLIICAFVYRSLSLEKVRELLLDGAKLSSVILFIVTGALVFGQVVTMLQIPEKLCNFLAALPIPNMAILFLVLIFILILGALMDEASILLITYPILFYIFVRNFGYDSIWFALIFLITLEVGLVAPPVGINLFVIQGVHRDAKFGEIVRGVMPFVILMVASILVFVYFKPLATWLPGLIG